MSSFDVSSIELTYLTTFSNGIKYCKSNRLHELYLPNKIISVETYLSFYKDELLAIVFNASEQNLNYLVEFINSFANNEDEFLFEDVLGGNSDLFCIQDDVAISINNRENDTIDFKIAVPISKRKNNVFV
ncbi:hypothetical protein BA195_04960 [Tenacibaculum soleae]|uniref:Uncharacterized protein n=2 Tax=Flavobacteriaceae TaxID=49546 RepID=A0A1B9Y2R2_9FLAO|nr:hypothetical protein BA195_04960 [Tenacibaculum soleae]